MTYSQEVLQTIKDMLSDDNGFTEQEQIEYTQELVEEFADEVVTMDQAKILYHQLMK